MYQFHHLEELEYPEMFGHMVALMEDIDWTKTDDGYAANDQTDTVEEFQFCLRHLGEAAIPEDDLGEIMDFFLRLDESTREQLLSYDKMWFIKQELGED